jgi:cytochrome c553
MRIRISWIGFAALNCALLTAAEVKLGWLAPDLAVKDCGHTTVHLSEYREKKTVVLLAQTQGPPLTTEVREEACRRLAPLNVAVLFLTGDAEAGPRLLEPAQAATILVDSGGTVRRIRDGQVLTGSRLAEFVAVWQAGKGIFETACARCHGVDGTLDICQDVKPLAGIGNRLTAAQIRERLRVGELNEREVLVRGQFFKRPELDAVIAYISGL